MAFLPMTRAEMDERGWSDLDFLLISGDAYVDHPSFGPALLGRLLEAEGYTVGILSQPDMNRHDSLLDMGIPRLAVLVASGVVDSMVDNYTAARKPRSDDSYSPGGKGGRRPDRTTIRYCNLVRAQMGDIPLIIGGIEASLRRLAHYDYWDHKVRRSILQDSQADLLVYGMGELTLLEIARLLSREVPVKNLTDLSGTCVLASEPGLTKKTQAFLDLHKNWSWQHDKPFDHPEELAVEMKDDQERSDWLDSLFPSDETHVLLPDYNTVAGDKPAYALSFRMLYLEQDPQRGRILIQPHSRRFLVQNPPRRPMTVQEMDRLYQLPFERRPHPSYEKKGGVPAISEVSMSITAHRGCFGGCHFCAIALHQGRVIQHRSPKSILAEAEAISQDPAFKGYIHDVGGPTANFHRPACYKQEQGTACRDRQCLFPEPCPALKADHQDYMSVLEQIRQLPGIKKVFIRSGIRFDYLLLDTQHPFLEQLCRHHISGQLKVAPEHTSRSTLQAMGKPPPEVFQTFSRRYHQMNKKLEKEQYLVPYLISGHPGCTLDDAIELALEIKASHVVPEQVQDFYPTPGTISTTMYYTGLHPLTMETVHVPKGEEKAMQRALLQYNRPRSRDMAQKALRLAGRDDLIGDGPQALIKKSGNFGSRTEAKPGRKAKPNKRSRTGGRFNKADDSSTPSRSGRKTRQTGSGAKGKPHAKAGGRFNKANDGSTPSRPGRKTRQTGTGTGAKGKPHAKTGGRPGKRHQ